MPLATLSSADTVAGWGVAFWRAWGHSINYGLAKKSGRYGGLNMPRAETNSYDPRNTGRRSLVKDVSRISSYTIRGYLLWHLYTYSLKGNARL